MLFKSALRSAGRLIVVVFLQPQLSQYATFIIWHVAAVSLSSKYVE
jgi:hypothetical protein